MLADRGGFWMEDWHKVPPRPEQRRLVGVDIVEVALNCVDRGRKKQNINCKKKKTKKNGERKNSCVVRPS